MKKFLTFLIIVGGLVGFCAFNQQPLRNIWTDISQKYFPCSHPITYTIGTFDPSFGISREQFLQAITQAEAVWEKPLGRQFFSYAPHGDLKINLVYDSRQQATDTLKKLGLTISNTKASYDAIKQKYDTMQAEYLSKKSAFESLVASFQTDKKTYDTEVAYWNTRGGANGETYARLQSESKALDAKATQIKSDQDNLNATVDNVNALVVTLNQVGSSLNLGVREFNTVGQENSGEFDEALYVRDGSGEHIDVYQFTDNQKLVRVLAHELGHALGLDHVDDPNAIMYRLNQSTNIVPTAADIAELKKVCGIK